MTTGWVLFGLSAIGLLLVQCVWNVSLSADKRDLQDALDEAHNDSRVYRKKAGEFSLQVSALEHVLEGTSSHLLKKVNENSVFEASVERLENYNEILEEKVEDLLVDNAILKAKVERLLDDVTKLAVKVPKHDAKGRFVKRG